MLGVPDFAAVAVPACPGSATQGMPGLAWGDVDGDGRPDLLLSCGGGVVLDHNEGNLTFRDATEASGLTGLHDAASAAFGDADGDHCLDVYVAGRDAGHLMLGDCHGSFRDATPGSGLPRGAGAASVAWVDYDRDARLDLALGSRDGSGDRLERNAGNATFQGVGSALGARASNGTTWATLWADFTNDRFPDAYLARDPGPAPFLLNLGGPGLRDVAAAAHVTGTDATTAAAALDVDGDGFLDLAVQGAQPRLWTNQRDGTFSSSDLPGDAGGSLVAADLNNDGWVDLVSTAGGEAAGPATLLLNEGGRFAPSRLGDGAGTLAVADADGDGRLDVAMAADGSHVALEHNLGTDDPVQGTYLQVHLVGNQSNSFGVDARLSVHENGTVYEAQALPQGGFMAQDDATVHFGLGHVHGQVDALEIDWPSGIHQALTDVDQNVTITVREDPSSKTSCPLLFVWDGTAMRFVSDVTGNAYTGWLVAPGGVHHPPDPDELVRVDGMVPAPDGLLDVRLLETLEETDYVDQVQLVAVDHPAGERVVPDEAFRITPPYPDFGLVPVVAPHPVAKAWDEDGRDWTAAVAQVDRSYPDVATLPAPTFDGYAQPHSLTLNLGSEANGHDPGHRLRLDAWGWVYYPMVVPELSTVGPYIAPQPPSLDALDPATGKWVHVQDDIGFPAGLPKWWSLDLTGKLPAGAHVVRITTNLRVYWDQLLVDQGQSTDSLTVQRVPASSATLEAAGYPLFASPDGKEPAVYDYARRSPSYVWHPQAGNYTRYGDVTPIVAARDDMFATYGPGDELRLRFDPSSLAPPPAGWERTYMLWFDLFTKDTDPHNAFPDTVEPLPFHGMANYPYAAGEHYPTDAAHDAYLHTYQTRTRPDARIPGAPDERRGVLRLGP